MHQQVVPPLLLSLTHPLHSVLIQIPLHTFQLHTITITKRSNHNSFQTYTNPLITLPAVRLTSQPGTIQPTFLIRPESHVHHHKLPLNPPDTMSSTYTPFQRDPRINALDRQRRCADYAVSKCQKSLADETLNVSQESERGQPNANSM
jgi:hypothetical protein